MGSEGDHENYNYVNCRAGGYLYLGFREVSTNEKDDGFPKSVMGKNGDDKWGGRGGGG